MASSVAPLTRTHKTGGAINPLSFVKLSTSTPGTSKVPVIVQCGAGDRPYGVAQNESAAALGDEVEVALPGGGGKITLGSAGAASAGNFLKSDASGYGTPTTTAGDAYGAEAVETGANSDIVGVHVVIGEKYNASA